MVGEVGDMMNRHTVEASGSMKQIMIMIAELDGSLYLSGVVPGLDLAVAERSAGVDGVDGETGDTLE